MADGVTLYEKRGRRYVPVAERDTYDALSMHDELVETLRELLAAHSAIYPAHEEGRSAQDAWAARKVCADNAAFAVIAKLESI